MSKISVNVTDSVVDAIGDISLLNIVRNHRQFLWIVPRNIAGSFIHYLYYAKDWDSLCTEIRNHHTVRDFYTEIGQITNVSNNNIAILRKQYVFIKK